MYVLWCIKWKIGKVIQNDELTKHFAIQKEKKGKNNCNRKVSNLGVLLNVYSYMDI